MAQLFRRTHLLFADSMPMSSGSSLTPLGTQLCAFLRCRLLSRLHIAARHPPPCLLLHALLLLLGRPPPRLMELLDGDRLGHRLGLVRLALLDERLQVDPKRRQVARVRQQHVIGPDEPRLAHTQQELLLQRAPTRGNHSRVACQPLGRLRCQPGQARDRFRHCTDEAAADAARKPCRAILHGTPYRLLEDAGHALDDAIPKRLETQI
mmetsp:Transcript_63811/g.142336  ORF Transcript_63811/g.142336 Transcript_63811/m.142336 type:complete len:208 (-) Transcript_63811:416-1039(-)